MEHQQPPGAPALTTPRRVFTAPQTLQSYRRDWPSSSSSQSRDLVETLYNHPSVKIISFAARDRSALLSPKRGNAPSEEEPGSLSWSSDLERTIAVGPFRIYRAPGSVAFLSCGSALQPILPKSQCWCIDKESSKFMLRIRHLNYWRLEVPVEEPEDQQRALLLREVMDKVLQFEKTPCPFRRNFTVELPERPQTPVQKRPWTPAPRRSKIPQSTTPPEGSPIQKASRHALDLVRRNSLMEPLPLGLNKVDARRVETATKRTIKRPVESKLRDAKPPMVDSLIVPTKVDAPAKVVDIVDEIEAKSAILDPTSAESQVEVITPEQEEVDDIDEPNDSTEGNFTENTEENLPEVSEERSSIEHGDAPWASDDLELIPARPEAEPSTRLTVGTEGSAPLDSSTLAEQSRASQPLESVKSAGVETILGTEKLPNDHETKADWPIDLPADYDTSIRDPQVSASDASSSSGDAEKPQVSSGLHEGSGLGTGSKFKRTNLRSLGGFRTGRSITAPPQLTLVTSPPSKSLGKLVTEQSRPEQEESDSPTDSSDSFHSIESWHSPITPPAPSQHASRPASPPTFPYPHNNITLPARSLHHRDVSDMTVTPKTGKTWDIASDEASEGAPESVTTAPDTPFEAVDKSSECASPEDDAGSSTALSTRRPNLRHRQTASISMGPRAFSPLPPAANLFSPPGAARRQLRHQSRMESVRRIPMAIISKTCGVLLGPPSHLISLMLKVAAKIAAGEWRGLVFGFGEGGEQIPVQWDYSDSEFGSWDDDDYCTNQVIGSRRNSHNDATAEQKNEAEDTSRSWEVD